MRMSSARSVVPREAEDAGKGRNCRASADGIGSCWPDPRSAWQGCGCRGFFRCRCFGNCFRKPRFRYLFESDYWYTGSGFFLTSLGLAYFAKESLMLCNTSDCRIRQFWSRSKRKHRPLTMCRFFRSSPSLRKVQAMYRRLLNRSKRKVSAEVVELVDTLP